MGEVILTHLNLLAKFSPEVASLLAHSFWCESSTLAQAYQIKV